VKDELKGELFVAIAQLRQISDMVWSVSNSNLFW